MPAAAARASSRNSGADAKGGVRLAKTVGRSRRQRQGNAGQHAGHQADRRRRQAGQPPLYRRRRRHRARALLLAAGRPRDRPRVASSSRPKAAWTSRRVAHDTPEKIITVDIDPTTGVTAADVAEIVDGAEARRRGARAMPSQLFPTLYKAFTEKDMSLLEVNPLIVMTDGHLRVLDAKVSFDNNAAVPPSRARRAARPHRRGRQGDRGVASSTSPMWRSTAISAAWSTAPASPWRPWTSSSSTAKSRRTSSMSAAAPRKEKVTAAFKIITADPQVKGILVNIFGGIMRCDVIAEGVIAAVKEVGLKVPLVVRLEGTNVKEGKAILDASGLNVISADDLDDAAQKIVAAIKGKRLMRRRRSRCVARRLALLRHAALASAPARDRCRLLSPQARWLLDAVRDAVAAGDVAGQCDGCDRRRCWRCRCRAEAERHLRSGPYARQQGRRQASASATIFALVEELSAATTLGYCSAATSTTSTRPRRSIQRRSPQLDRLSIGAADRRTATAALGQPAGADGPATRYC